MCKVCNLITQKYKEVLIMFNKSEKNEIESYVDKKE